LKSLSLKIQQLEESQTLAFTMRARQLREQGADVVSLTAGEPDFPTPMHVKMAAIRAIEENFTHYTSNAGIPELLKAIQQKFEKDNNLKFDTKQLLVSCGAKHSIYNVLQAICNKGDEVVIAAPFWVSYPEMVRLVDAKPVIVSADAESRYKITPQQLRKAINQHTKAFIFNSPNNPTGAVYSQGEIEELAEVIQETGIFVIADEIYEKLVYDKAKHFSIGSIKEIAEQVVTVNGVSKAYAMTGWRIGFLGASKSIVDGAAKVQSQVTSNASSISQRAATAALCGPQQEIADMVTEFQRRRDFICDRLAKVPGLDVNRPQGAFYMFLPVKNFVNKRIKNTVMKDDMDICRFFLDEELLAMVPGGAFGAKDHIRLSYACSMKDLEKSAKRLQSGFKKLQEGW
jgi:aspartate aminotransferase